MASTSSDVNKVMVFRSFFRWKPKRLITPTHGVSLMCSFKTPPHYPIVQNAYGTTYLEYALNWVGIGFDLTGMRRRSMFAKKGKPIVFHGAADPVFSVAGSFNWYDALSVHYKKQTKDFARFFMV